MPKRTAVGKRTFVYRDGGRYCIATVGFKRRGRGFKKQSCHGTRAAAKRAMKGAK